MSSGQKPRTPRYYPSMKVRGARRKKLRTMYLFQRIGDAGSVSAVAVMGLGTALINVQNTINRMYERQVLIERMFPPTEPYDLAELGASIMKEEHGEH